MASEAKRRKGGKYCVCGGPGGISCTNSVHTSGISMHLFPNEKSRLGDRNRWTKFVRKHVPNFSPTSSSVICSAHFDPSCYATRYSLGVPANLKPRSTYLNPGSVPTEDSVVPAESAAPFSKRERRMILREVQSLTTVQSSTSFISATACCSTGRKENIPEKTDNNTKEAAENNIPLETAENSTQNTQITSNMASSSASRLACERCEIHKDKIHKLQKTNWRMKCQLNTYREKNKKLMDENRELQKLVEAAEEATDSEDNLSNYYDGGDNLDNNVYADGASSHIAIDEESSEGDGDGNEDNLDENYDPDWDEYMGADEVDEDFQETKSERDVRVEPGTPVVDEPKFIVFYTMLVSLFSMFCFKCKAEGPSVSMKVHGTMVTVLQQCRQCGDSFKWQSQPLVIGRYPSGNVLLSFAVLMAGASVSKILLIFKHVGLAAYSARTFFYHQSKFIFPVVLTHWEASRAALIGKIKTLKTVTFCGDGRFDSMGHSAKYGAYSMLCCDLSKIVHFELLQSNETGSSNAMELEGAKRSFTALNQLGVKIKVFISDRHRGIAKWMRLFQTQTTHFFDIWHIAKSITKKVLKASKENGCEILKKWTKSIRTHLHWCAISTKTGFGSLIVAKWESFLRHVSNKHKDHPNVLYTECAHGELTHRRKYIKYCSKPYEKLRKILQSKSIVNDVRKMSPEVQTSCLEGFHATLNHWHPKMLSFSWMGTYCRHVLACLHFNENVGRTTRKTRDGRQYIKVTYPKYKLGDELVREVSMSPTYAYVDAMKKLLFTMPVKEMRSTYMVYKRKTPETLTAQFTDRLKREDAIKHDSERKKIATELFPPIAEQDKLHMSELNKNTRKRKEPKCTKCGHPMKGHSKTQCQRATT